MKKLFVLGLGLCVLMAFSSCKSKKESAYKTAYDQAKQQELVQGHSQASDPIEIAPVNSNTVTKADASYRSEKVILASGAAGSLKAYSVVCGSFSSKTNADALRTKLVGEGYQSQVVKSPSNMYRVILSTHDDKVSAAQSRDKIRATYPDAWLLYQK